MQILEAGPRTNPELNEAIGGFISQQIWQRPDRLEQCSTLGVFDGGRIVAGLAYHNWHQEAGIIEITGAALTPRWLTRPVLRRMFAYPFDQLGCQLVVMRVSERNAHTLKILHRYGFDLHRIPRLRGRDEAEYICTLTDEVWRSHGDKQHGQA